MMLALFNIVAIYILTLVLIFTLAVKDSRWCKETSKKEKLVFTLVSLIPFVNLVIFGIMLSGFIITLGIDNKKF